MTIVDLGEWVLRAFGVLYALGALFMFWALRLEFFMSRAMADLERALAEANGGEALSEDHGRKWWLAAGALLTLMAGIAMALGLRASIAALVSLLLHQIFYFLRQRRLELRAASPEQAEDARPTRATRNGFYSCVLQTVLAAWLGWAGALD